MKTSHQDLKSLFSESGEPCNPPLSAHLALSLKVRLSVTVLAVLGLCAACADVGPNPTTPPAPTHPPPTPSPTPEPVVLTVCLPEEPDSLYLYGTSSQAAQHVWQTIYDGPLDTRNYAYQPVILTSLPSFANGNATVKTIAARAGDRVLAANGDVVELAPGVIVQNADGEQLAFDGTPVSMAQMVVTYTLHSELYWSDGALLTADDSVFSFELAADPATPTDKHVIERTAAYRAADIRTLVWSGVPGFLDRAYVLNLWHPLPRHAWGQLSATELLTAEVATRHPLGWGPFTLDEWIPGDHITVVRNPIYFRTPEGLPRVDAVTFRFITDPILLAEELLTERCDIVTHDATDAVRAALPSSLQTPQPEGPGEGTLSATEDVEKVAPVVEDITPFSTTEQIPGGSMAISSPAARWELIGFGISPSPDHARPDVFEDVRVRQAVALCIDRQTMVDQILGPAGRVLNSYLPPEHPLYAGDGLITWGYDPAAAQALLATAGWYDEDGDSVREAHSIPGIPDGTPFQVTYHTTDDPLRIQTAQLVQVYLADCGIQAGMETVSPQALFASGPEGVLFGRRFDLAQFSWHATHAPLCDTFMSDQMPAVGHWSSPNVVGFLDDEYDTACLAASLTPPGSETYAAAHVEPQRIFSERLPALPLFQWLKTTLARTTVIGLAPDPTQFSELWNIEQLDQRP
jgi:peptide/nickel transport system substrate-binding protein